MTEREYNAGGGAGGLESPGLEAFAPRDKGRSCLFWGCGCCLLLALLAVAGSGGCIYVGYRQLLPLSLGARASCAGLSRPPPPPPALYSCSVISVILSRRGAIMNKRGIRPAARPVNSPIEDREPAFLRGPGAPLERES